MKVFLKKYKWPLLLIAADLLLIPLWFFCRWLSERMLESETVCLWLLLGGKCITCGGTHFVNSLLNLHIAEAFHHNEFLFIVTAYLAVSLVLLNLMVLLRARWAKRILSWMYNIPTLILFFVSMFGFMLVRNLTPIMRITELIWSRLF